MIPGTEIFLLVMLLVFSGIFSGAEVALISLTDARIAQMQKKKLYGAEYVYRLKQNPQRMLSAILIGNNIANIGAASLMTYVMINLFGSWAVGIATGIMTVLVLIFGEITPKTVATQHNAKFARMVGPLIWFISKVLQPVLWALEKFLNFLLKTFGLENQQAFITEDELKHIVSAAEEEGTIKAIEKKLIHNVFKFDETHVSDIITPRADMVMISADATVTKALNLIAKEKHSRMPVYEGQKENIVGILYLRDLLARKKATKVKSIMKKPYAVPETKMISQLLNEFQTRKEHLALVVDEHGHTTGLVTLEDVLEEIVGDIVDESEDDEPNIKRRGLRKWAVSGKTPVQELNKKLKLRIPAGEYETVSGFILEQLGHIPSDGEEVSHGKIVLTVQSVQGNRIVSVLVKK